MPCSPTPPHSRRRSQLVHLSLPAPLYDQLRQRADKEDRPMSRVVRSLLAAGLERGNAQAPLVPQTAAHEHTRLGQRRCTGELAHA